MAKSLNAFMAAGLAALSLTLISGAAYAQEDATVGFLMPDQASTRYEEHDSPGFIAEMKKLCPNCKVIYQNADARCFAPAAAVQLGDLPGRQGHRARSGELGRGGLAGQAGAGAGHQGHRL